VPFVFIYERFGYMKFVKRFVYDTCIYFTVITLIYTVFAAIRNSSGKYTAEIGLPPEVCGTFILFAALMGAADLIFLAQRKLGYLYTVLLHFIASVAAFIVFYKIFQNDNDDLTKGLFVGLILFIILYAIVMLIISLINHKFSQKSNAKQEYTPMFSSKDK